MNLDRIYGAIVEGVWLVFLLLVAVAICGACFFAIGYLVHLGWTAW